MPVIKEYRCNDHGDFESTFPICPTCKKISKRVFLTAPHIGSVKQQNVNRILEDVLPSQNLTNYTNATGYPKPTFSNIYTNQDGLRAGWGMESLKALGVPQDVPLTKVDVNTGQRSPVDLATVAANLPKVVTAEAGAQVGIGSRVAKGNSVLSALTQVERRYDGK